MTPKIKTRPQAKKPKGQVVRQPQNGNRRARRTANMLVSVPSARSRVLRMEEPRLMTSLRGGKAVTVIHHREFLADISGSTGFTARAYPVNPGLPGTFPWLASVAGNWDSYLFKKLEFSYETSCSSTTPGAVMLAIDFDAADPAPPSKLALMTYEGAVRSPSWSECCYDARLSNLEKFGIQRYTRSSGLSANQDIKTYDVGNLFIATSGQADAAVIGELYVDYTVELYTPQINPSIVENASARIIGLSPGVGNLFGLIPEVIGTASITATANVITFNQPGEFLVELVYSGTPLVAPTYVVSGGVTFAIVDADGNGSVRRSTTVVRVPNFGTMTVVIGNVTVTNSTARIASYATSLG